MSDVPPIRDGQPRSYWVFRNFVTVFQILVALALFGGISIWLGVSGNGTKLWADYYQFSQQASAWGNSALHYPWESGSESYVDSDDSGSNEPALDRPRQHDSNYQWIADEYCTADSWIAFEGETELYNVIVCVDEDANWTIANGNQSDGYTVMEAAQISKSHWIGWEDEITHEVTADEFTILDSSIGSESVEQWWWTQSY